jgi:hypothetical protein
MRKLFVYATLLSLALCATQAQAGLFGGCGGLFSGMQARRAARQAARQQAQMAEAGGSCYSSSMNSAFSAYYNTASFSAGACASGACAAPQYQSGYSGFGYAPRYQSFGYPAYQGFQAGACVSGACAYLPSATPTYAYATPTYYYPAIPTYTYAPTPTYTYAQPAPVLAKSAPVARVVKRTSLIREVPEVGEVKESVSDGPVKITSAPETNYNSMDSPEDLALAFRD